MQLEQYLAHADHLMQIGDLKQAEIRCAAILAMRPDYAPALHLLGIIAFKSGDLDRAIEYIQRACKANNVPASYLSNLAEMLRRKGRLTEGEAAARRAIARDDKFLGGWNNLAVVLQESGKLEESTRCFERVLRSQPNNAQVHDNLGTIFSQLGQLGRAERHWKRAAAIAPDFAAPASNLAALYLQWGLIEEAAEYGRKAIGGKPVQVEAYLNLAMAETARSNFSQALRVLERARNIESGDARVLTYRAVVLSKCNRTDEALECIERAIAIAPNYARGQFTFATLLRALGRNEDALESFERAAAVSSGPTREQALINRAALLGEMGDAEEALAAVDKVIEEYPASASAHLLRADFVKFSPGDPAISAMQDVLESTSTNARSDRISLGFALGKAFLDTGDSAAALKHLNEANRLARSGFDYDADASSAWASSVAAATPGETIETASRAGFRSTVPVFVIGMPRSGTSLIEQILASHGDVFGAGELTYISELADQHGGLSALLVGTPRETLAAIGKEYVARLIKLAEGKSRVVDKLPGNFLYVGLIHMMLPDAKIIHVVRDPVDTCFSCYSKYFVVGEQRFSYDLSELARYYKDYEKLMEHWRRVIPQTHLLDVRYEDVVTDLEPQARRMLDFLGLPWDDAVLSFHRADRTVRTASFNQVRRPVYKTSVGAWRAHAASLQPLLAGLGIDAGS